MPLPLQRRAAIHADVPFLMDLRRRTMSGHLAAAGVAASEDEHLARVMFRFDCAQILLDDGSAMGLQKICRDASPWKLIQIQILPEMQGRGFGSEILAQLTAEADNAHVALALGVLKGNRARTLYERSGFVVVGESAHEFDMLRLAWTSCHAASGDTPPAL